MPPDAPLSSFPEYLEASYSPDREFIDGRIEERNAGFGKHSYAQGNLASSLGRLNANRIFAEDHPPQEVHGGKLAAERLGIEVHLADVLPS